MLEPRPGDAFQPGELLNNTYRIEALLGRGGTSDVYKARNEISGRLVALKVLKAEFSGNDDYLVLLKREEEMREIRHDAVVRYSENHRTSTGLIYLLMDYVEGPGLEKKLREGPMPVDDLMVICRRVTEGLEAAHSRNIIHRDLSPDNIILREGDPAQAVIIDFGIAKDTNPGAETIVGNEFAGKYAYAAPEQLNGQTDARSDIYSLGALLLAAFRGKSPDVGANPMEVVQRKGEALDTSGLPDPFKALIDRMAAPDPAARFQTATDVLAFLRNPAAASAPPEADPDATIIAPIARARSEEPPTVPPPELPPEQPATRPVAKPVETNPEPVRKSRGGLIATLAVLLLAGGGAGGYFSGAFDAFLGPTLPLADPYTLVVAKPDGAAPSAVGNVPSETVQVALGSFMREHAGTAQLTLARGDIAQTWGADVMTTLEQIEALDNWRLAISGNRGQVTGETSDQALHGRLVAALANDLPGALTGGANIEFKPVFLAAEAVQQALETHADCGRLTQLDVPTVGYGPTTPIKVQGRVAGTATRVQLFDTLRALAGDRQVVVDVEVLNPTLCLLESRLPRAPQSDIDVAFTVGDRDEPNPSGRFFVGENPVIDVVLPADVTDGFLSVSILDVSGNVFHLLPNLSRQDNAVTILREGQTGEARVRVAYDLEEAARNGRLAFQVDDSTLGKSKVVVIHSSQPLFDGLRPTSESAAGYASALEEFAGTHSSSILSLDSRILTTAQP